MNHTCPLQAQAAISLARKTAVNCHHSYIGTEHLLIGLLKEGSGAASQILQDFQVSEEKILQLIESLIAPVKESAVLTEPEMTPRAQAVLDEAAAEAEHNGLSKAGTEHILLAMLAQTDCVGARLLYTMGINMQRMMQALFGMLGMDEKAAGERMHQLQNRQAEGSSTPVLDQYSRDLTLMAGKQMLDPVVGRS